MDEKTELEPCPFCGSIPTIEPWHGGRPTKKMVSCQGAEANSVMGRGPVTCAVAPCVTGETKKAAIAAWNRRSPSLERVEVLEAQLAKAAEQFEFYAQEHRVKARNAQFNGLMVNAESAVSKAETNERFAAECRAALGEKADG